MRVLMLSGDTSILNPNSPAGKRTEEYRNVFGELEVLLCYGNFFNFVSGFWRGFILMRQKKFDVITAQSPEHWFLAWVLSRFFRVSWQMQIHTDIFSPYFVRHSMLNKIRFLLAKFLIPRSDGTRVVSERIKVSILNTMDIEPRTKISVFPIFVDVEKIKNAPVKIDLHQKYPGKFIILMASRLTKEKNIRIAIESLKELLSDNSPLQPPSLTVREGGEGGRVNILLLIVGEGSEKENLQSLVSGLRLNDNVIFENWTNDLASYYKTRDLFLLTSNYEGYGMTLVEAVAAGAKIVSSDVGIAPEILEKENIFRVGDKYDLVEKLKFAIEGKVKPAKLLPTQTKEEYLRLYKEYLEKCIKK